MKMVVLASVKVDLRNVTFNDAKRLLSERGFKTKEQVFEKYIVHFHQMDIKDLVNEGYEMDSDNKIMDSVYLRLYKNDDRSGTETSKKELVAKYKDWKKGTKMLSPRRTAKVSPRKNVKVVSKKTSPKKTSPRKTNAKKDDADYDDYDDGDEYY